MYVCIYMYKYKHIHICIHVYDIHTCIHTNIHIHIYMYMQKDIKIQRYKLTFSDIEMYSSEMWKKGYSIYLCTHTHHREHQWLAPKTQGRRMCMCNCVYV